ncbi:calcium-binding mitochondrial carrier protein SCaMC-1 [Cynara cardunculus var. scolymus]|uniref:calcium-binding mitochondrial carrier protein SCaMC-1 n=1 Tax=Cynara cardunculus var. scolymus TaxID=59895 RepID=UPI000D6312B8|nr:calcium-binding mitochondrial carrier protein SCaMC-1 [Cynara cardunculus var. scolymus]
MVNVNGNDPLESFLNSIELVKNALGPLESSFRKAARDFERRWPGSKNETKTGEIAMRNEGKVELFGVKKKNGQGMVGDERKKGLSSKVPFKSFLGIFIQNDAGNSDRRVDMSKKELDVQDCNKEDGTCINCMQFAVTWSLLVSSFVQAVPGPFRNGKKKLQKKTNGDKLCKHMHVSEYKSKISRDKNDFMAKGAFPEDIPGDTNQTKLKSGLILLPCEETLETKDGNNMSLEHFIGFVFDQLALNLQKFELGAQESGSEKCDFSKVPPPTNQVDHFKAVGSLLEGKKADFSGFLGNLKFARVGGVPSGIVDLTSPVKGESDDNVSSNGTEENVSSFSQKMANGLLSIPLSNVERLRSTLSTVSLTELIELVPQLGRSPKDHPDKKKLFSVQDFFRYTEAEGRRFFEELDRDGDGQVTLEDLEVATRKRKLPRRYAHELMRRTRRHLFSKSFGWKQFLSLMEQKEPTILRAYTSLCLSKSGTLQKSEILASLKNAGLPANEDNAVAMMRFLKSDTEESISYGHFRNFMLLLPSDQLKEDPRNLWFQAATVVAVAPPVEVHTGSVLKSALAGGLACALSTSVMHPIDTIKTRVQASTLTFPEILAKLPQVGVRGVYRGSVPAIIGQFSSHGLRTGIFEASKIVLINVAPTLPDLQVQSIASFCSTVLGTAVRIPCEVLKQRLQAGIFNNVGEAIVCTWQQDGLRGFFRGTGATLCREVPFYVAGMGLYGESKKVVQRILGRELEPWETIAVGAISGGLAAVTTTPFDVMKTRMMTAPQGRPVSMSMVALSILQHEGPLGLFKGAVPRFFWIAPLGAMNFAGYELMKNAISKSEEQPTLEQQAAEQLSQK